MTEMETTTAKPGREPAKQPIEAPSKPPAQEPAKIGSVEVEAFAHNIARLVEEGGKALAAYLKPREEGKIKDETADSIADVVKTIGQVTEYWLADPQRAQEVQIALGRAYLDLWASAVKRMAGEATEPMVAADPKDKRFTDPEWSQNQFFDFLKQVYLLTVQWSERLVRDAEVDEQTRQKAAFYVKQIGNAIAPSNFVLTNPELLRETLAAKGENLVRGMQHAGGRHPGRARQSQDPPIEPRRVRGRPQSRAHPRRGGAALRRGVRAGARAGHAARPAGSASASTAS